jgi:hypothetical protein
MKDFGAIALLVLGFIAVGWAGLAIYLGQIWCVPRTGFEWKPRWIRRSREAQKFWYNTIIFGIVGAACIIAGCRALFR